MSYAYQTPAKAAYYVARDETLPDGCAVATFALMSRTKYPLPQILANLNIEALNEMQEASLTANEQHSDVILLSPTGSGKTLAFLLPLLPLLDPSDKVTKALIITPSRELALQIEQVFRSLGTGIKITCCYGGHKREVEENSLLHPPSVIVGTPGRLADHIRRGNITVDAIEALVLDEFDKSLELGFDEEMAYVTGALTGLKKRILTSATDTEEMPLFVGLKDPAELNFLTGEIAGAEKLAVKTVHSPENDKLDTLFRIICAIDGRSAIVFCNHRESVERVSELLSAKGIPNEFYHGAMEQRERESALCKFRNGTVTVLVTTDLASRGLDIPNIRYIIHYHLPHTADSFTHRNGRTARMDASGTILIILSPEETLPEYVEGEVGEMNLPEEIIIPPKPKWTTFFIAAGKKDKVNKGDIMGFLANKGELKAEDIGLIEVKDFFAFAAVRKVKASHALQLVQKEKIKNKKVKIEVAK